MQKSQPSVLFHRTLNGKFVLVMIVISFVTLLSFLGLRYMDKVSLFHYLERQHLRAMLDMKALLSHIEQQGIGANSVPKAKIIEYVDEGILISQRRDIELFGIEVDLFKLIGFSEVMDLPEEAGKNLLALRTKLIDAPEAFITPGLMEKIQDNVSKELSISQRFGPANREAAVFVRNAVLTMALLNFILLLMPVISLRRGVVEPLRLAMAAANQVARGDLTSHINFESKDEVGQLFASLRSMTDSLREIVMRTREASERVALQSTELVGGNHTFAQRITEQSATLEELASLIEEFTATIKRTAAHSQEVAGAATNANDLASKGGAAVRELMKAIQAINMNVEKTADIIDVIDSLAFQTNILALNAAVEAARAGEQGRGFAVVAQEVRALAQKCASSSKEIKALIGSSLDQVAAGTQLANQVGTKIEDVLVANDQVRKLVLDIAGAMSEQALGIDEVNKGINHIDQVTQQNVDLMEKTATLSDAMHAEASNLYESVQVFKLSDTTGAASALRAANRRTPVEAFIQQGESPWRGKPEPRS